MVKPKVFVSYCWNDSEASLEWMHSFVNTLRMHGIDATFDRFEMQKGNTHIGKMMADEFEEADYIIPIITQMYCERANANKGGIGFEKLLTLNYLTDFTKKDKILVLKKSDNKDFQLPNYLNGYYYLDFSNPHNFDEKIDELLHKILKIDQFEVQEIKARTRKLETKKSNFDVLRQSPNKQGKSDIIEHSIALSKSMYQHLNFCGLELSNLSEECFNKTSSIIWPVVPRSNITLIHRGQMEVIRLLCGLLNWKAHILIANCGDKRGNTVLQSDVLFKDSVKGYLEKRGLAETNYEFSFLSDYFSQNSNTIFSNNPKTVLDEFVIQSSKLSISTLLKFNTKDLPKTIQDRKLSGNTLDILRPLLTCVITKLLADSYRSKHENKSIILAGNDESRQWKFVFDMQNSDNLGSIYIPILELEGDDNALQDPEITNFYSVRELQNALFKGNTFLWLYSLFACLPNIQNEDFNFLKREKFTDNDFLSQYKMLEEIERDSNSAKNFLNLSKFCNFVFEVINPAK